MLVSGADLRFVAAAVQSWCLPQSAADDKLSRRAQGSLKLSLAVLCLAGLVNVAQSVVCSTSCIALLLVCWLAAETLYFIYGHFRCAFSLTPDQHCHRDLALMRSCFWRGLFSETPSASMFDSPLGCFESPRR